MAWSTREIAQLAGTSLRTVRHYHEVGLLELPERRANGYKQYSVTHLVRILHIKRLTELGFSLSQIAGMTETDSRPEEALRALDAELSATIERLQRARLELGLILRQSTPTVLPSEFTAATAVTDLSNADRSFVTVLSRVLGPQTLQAWADMLQKPVTDRAALQFTHLADDADEQTRADLARRLVPYIRGLYGEHPAISITSTGTPHSQQYVEETVSEALTQLYNPAQLDVLRRTNRLLAGTSGPEDQRAD